MQGIHSAGIVYVMYLESKNTKLTILDLSAPFSHIVVGDLRRGDLPWTGDATAGETFEVKLTAHLWIWATAVRDIVAVEWHHVAEHTCVTCVVCIQEKKGR